MQLSFPYLCLIWDLRAWNWSKVAFKHKQLLLFAVGLSNFLGIIIVGNRAYFSSIRHKCWKTRVGTMLFTIKQGNTVWMTLNALQKINDVFPIYLHSCIHDSQLFGFKFLFCCCFFHLVPLKYSQAHFSSPLYLPISSSQRFRCPQWAHQCSRLRYCLKLSMNPVPLNIIDWHLFL